MTVITQAQIERARQQEYGEKMTIQRHGPVRLPQEFEASALSIPDGAEEVYREDRPTDSIQVRVYEDKVTLQLDKYNPQYRPVQYAVADAPLYTAVAVRTLAAAFSG